MQATTGVASTDIEDIEKPPPAVWQELTVRNAHPRDKDIIFIESSHTYYIKKSKKNVISCTGFIHDFFHHFDADKVIDAMIRRGLKPEYQGMTKEQIKAKWTANGEESSGKGTALHLAIEQFIHGHPEVIEPSIKETPEWRYFMNFWRDTGGDLIPYRSEWEVWSEQHRLCGSIDMVFYRKSDDSYVIYDWKRSKEIKKESFGGQTGFGPVSHLPDCNYWHYTLQLNIYRWFLETLYGLKISDMYLVIMHPNNKNYQRFRLNRLEDEVLGMLECRMDALKEGKGKRILLPAEEEEHEEAEEVAPSGPMFLD